MPLKTGLIALLAAGALLAQNATEKRLQEAETVFHETMDMVDQGIPRDLLAKAHCIVVVPGLKKGAFIFGGKFGRGFMSCRKEGANGWSAPGAVRVEGGSFGLQIGGSETDVIMLVMNASGKGKLLSSKFTLGADASAAAGPVGRTAAAQTDAQMNAEILTYSRARGLFAGISLDGATLRQDDDAVRDLYGKKISNRDIVTTNVAVPASAQGLIQLFTRYSAAETK